MTKLCPRGKAAAKRKFKVYPSAYANAYASKICAGKAKDPSGVRRKDFKGPKPSGSKVASAARNVRSANKGGEMKRTVKKAGLGALFVAKKGARGKGALLPMFGLAGMAKYLSMNKKKGQTVTPVTDKQSADYATMQELEANKKTAKMKTGDMVELTDTFEGHDVQGGSIKGEYGINSSMSNYYKDILG